MATTATEKTLKPSSLADLEKKANATVQGPSGGFYTIRPLILEHHVVAGNLPGDLLEAALKGDAALEEYLAKSDEGDEKKRQQELKQAAADSADYVDNLIVETVIAPKLTIEDLRQKRIPAVDYQWLSRIALRKEGGDVDGEGKEIFGRPPLDRFLLFRSFHGCSEDCAHCQTLLDAFSQPDARVSNNGNGRLGGAGGD